LYAALLIPSYKKTHTRGSEKAKERNFGSRKLIQLVFLKFYRRRTGRKLHGLGFIRRRVDGTHNPSPTPRSPFLLHSSFNFIIFTRGSERL
jgi:hypothetical protein